MIAASTSLEMVVSQATAATDRVAMLRIGQAVVLMIRARTLRGIGADGRPFAGYSTRRIYINPRRGTGARLKPKGGKPSRTGRTMRFDGGYAEFKRLSRGAGQLPQGGAATGPTAEVDLTLSGQMLRSLGVAQASERAVVVQVGDAAAEYAAGVQELRPFMGVAPQDMPALQRIAQAAVADALARAGTRQVDA